MLGGGRILFGGTPPRLLRCSPSAASLVEQWRHGGAPSDGRAAAILARQLIDRGMAHPRPVAVLACPAHQEPPEPSHRPVTAVIPVRDDAARLQRLLGALGSMVGCDRWVARVIVVDDGSRDQGAVASALRSWPRPECLELVVRSAPGGSAAARQDGIDLVRTPLVLCCDSDTVPDPHCLELLVGHLADPSVAAVAPRVRAIGPPCALTGYEQRCSPLDLGPDEGLVGPGRRLTYVPSATVLLRCSALVDVGGFERTLAYGEDVDFGLRLVAAGWAIRYEPRAEVGHDRRPNLRALARQRYRYGLSAAPLAARHGDVLAPVAARPPTAIALLLLAAGLPGAGSLVLGASVLQLRQVLRRFGCSRREAGTEAIVAVAAGTWAVARTTAETLLGPWWPALAWMAISGWRTRLLGSSGAARRASRGRRCHRVALVAAAIACWPDRARATPGDERCPIARYVAYRVLDRVAYGTGVLVGCARAGRVEPLVPVILRRSRSGP